MAKASGPIYQLKITLRRSRPPIWRRVLVPGGFSLYKLHEVIQIAFGWYGDHLHQFTIDGEYYSIPSPEDWEPVIDERRHKLQTEAPAEGKKFLYEYDFGDSWEHEILVEKILPPEPGVTYPVCLTGRRAGPPEDIGGIWGYEHFLQVIADPQHEEHKEYLEWVGGDFDPAAFDLDAINNALRRLA